MVGPAVLQSAAQKSTEEQRAKWREKYDRKKARKNGEQYVPKVSVAPAPLDRDATPVASVAAVPWNPATLLPLAETLVDSFERTDIEGLADKAKKISPELAADVRKDAPWHPASKKALAASGSAIGAKWLARLGIKEENAPEVVFLSAVGAIMTGRHVLVSKLDKMLEEMKKNAPEKKSSTDAPA